MHTHEQFIRSEPALMPRAQIFCLYVFRGNDFSKKVVPDSSNFRQQDLMQAAMSRPATMPIGHPMPTVARLLPLRAKR